MPSIAAAQARDQQTIPPGACLFAWQDTTKADRTENTFRIHAYDGGIIEGHWYWKNLAFDLKGLSFASDPLPVLESHYTGARIGVTTEHQIRDAVTFRGKFLSNSQAQQLRQDMLDGFPMQASLSVRPSRIERIEEGAAAQVNGRTLRGPGNIFRQARIDEVSICVFGAAPNTSTTAFAGGRGPVIVPVAFDEATATDDQLRAHFAATQHLRDQFSGPDAYVANVRHTGGRIPTDALAVQPGDTLAALENENRRLLAQLRIAEDRRLAENLTDEQLVAHFTRSPDLRDQFSSAQAYVAHMRHLR
jgi:hypothetical protein